MTVWIYGGLNPPPTMHHIPVSWRCPVGRTVAADGGCGGDDAAPLRCHLWLQDVSCLLLSARPCKHTSVLVKGAVRAKSCFGNRPNRTEDRRGAGRDQLPHTSATCRSHETRSSLHLRGSFLKSSFFCCGNIYCTSVFSRLGSVSHLCSNQIFDLLILSV